MKATLDSRRYKLSRTRSPTVDLPDPHDPNNAMLMGGLRFDQQVGDPPRNGAMLELIFRRLVEGPVPDKVAGCQCFQTGRLAGRCAVARVGRRLRTRARPAFRATEPLYVFDRSVPSDTPSWVRGARTSWSARMYALRRQKRTMTSMRTDAWRTRKHHAVVAATKRPICCDSQLAARGRRSRCLAVEASEPVLPTIRERDVGRRRGRARRTDAPRLAACGRAPAHRWRNVGDDRLSSCRVVLDAGLVGHPEHSVSASRTAGVGADLFGDGVRFSDIAAAEAGEAAVEVAHGPRSRGRCRCRCRSTGRSSLLVISSTLRLAPRAVAGPSRPGRGGPPRR